MTGNVPVPGLIVPTVKGQRVVRARDSEITPDTQHRNFPSVTTVQELYDALDTASIVPGVAVSPYKYFQRLDLDSGISQLPTTPVVLNSANNFTFTHTLVPLINTNGGIVADVPFLSEYYGALRARVTTAVTLVVTARFYHFSGQANEFSNTQRVAFRFSADRESEIELRDLSSPPITLTLGPLQIPNGPLLDITDEFLNTVFPYRIELEFESFDTTTGNVNTATTISDMELVEPTIAFSQLAKTTLTEAASNLSVGVVRFTNPDGSSLPVLDGTSQATLVSSFTGHSILKGQTFRFRNSTIPAAGRLFNIGFIRPFDTISAKVDGASLNAAGDWAVLRDGLSYPVTQLEAHFLDTITEPTTGQFKLGPDAKIGRDNFDAALEASFAALGNGNIGEILQELQTHLEVSDVAGAAGKTPRNPTQHRGTITRLFAAGFEENRLGATPFTGNNFEDLADPVITLTDGNWFFFADPDDAGNVLFPGQKSYFTGQLAAAGLPLSDNFKVIYGFSVYVNNETFNTEISLMTVGNERIIGLDGRGLFAQQGVQDGPQISVSFDRRLFNVGGTSTIQYLRGTGVQTVAWFVPDTITTATTFTIRFKVVDSGLGRGAASQTNVEYVVTDREVSQAQSSQVVAMNILPSGTRDETITLEYDATTHTIIVGTPGLSQNTSADVTQLGMEVTFNDSEDVNTSTNHQNAYFAQQDAHRGRRVDVLFLIEAANLLETTADKSLEIKAVIDLHQENNIELHFRDSVYDFSQIKFGPTASEVSDVAQIAMSNVQAWQWDDGGDPANTPLHEDLGRLAAQLKNYLGLWIPPGAASRKFLLDGDLGLRNVVISGTEITVDIIEDGTAPGGYRWSFAAL